MADLWGIYGFMNTVQVIVIIQNNDQKDLQLTYKYFQFLWALLYTFSV